MGREKRGKQTLRKKMMVVMLISAMSSILAVVIVSYMTIRMIRNDSIQESMQIYLEQITRETDSAYYDMISIVNQMSPSGLIGNVVESYLSAEDNFDKYTGQKSLREELVKLGYVNTKLLGVTYYDLEEQSELIRNINVRNLDQVYQTIPNVTENIGNTIQAMHSSCLGIRERPVISVKRRVSFSNRQKLDIYAEIEPDMSVAERLNKENWTYTYMELDENGIVQYSNNPAIIRGQQLLSKLPEKEEYAVTSQEGYKVMVYRSEIGYANAIALQENTYQKEMNMWRLKLLSYNLGKEGVQTTLRTEIDIVKEYIALQQMRYDFVIEMNVEEGSYLEQPTVRMLLQPLVENAIQYGLGKDEKITMRIFEDNRRGLAAITIADSGNGLTIEEINQINAPFDYNLQKMQNGNRGIGLRYVKAMLDSFYEGQTNLFVNCKKGHGTKITILIPVQEELRDKAKVTDTGIE